MVKLNTVSLNRVCINTVDSCSINNVVSGAPEENITDALIMEDGSLFLMEDGSYFKLENQENSSAPKKSYWNF